MIEIKENILLSPYSSYKVGGRASFLATPKSYEELQAALNFAKEKALNFEVIAGGYNILVSDNGFDGLIIHTGLLNNYIILNGNKAIAGAGVSLPKFVSYISNKGLNGISKMSGIPGTIGGAVRMNAGAFGEDISQTLLKATILREDGTIALLSNDEIGFGYRKSANIQKHDIILKAEFSFNNGDKEALKAEIKEILSKRNEKQPLHKPSCGSVFKRGEGYFAGSIIEECGLKGYRIGGAIVSEKHANFILNEDNAKASDIKELIDHVIKTVKAKKNITLEPEVQFIGF